MIKIFNQIFIKVNDAQYFFIKLSKRRMKFRIFNKKLKEKIRRLPK